MEVGLVVSDQPNLIKNSLLSSSLIENIASIKNMFESCEDIEYKHMGISNVEGCLIYHPGMVDLQLLTEIESHVVTINEHHTVRTKQTTQNVIKKNFLPVSV